MVFGDYKYETSIRDKSSHTSHSASGCSLKGAAPVGKPGEIKLWTYLLVDLSCPVHS